MDKVAIIPFKGTDVHFLYKKGQLGYSFELGGKAYGQRVTLQGKRISDIISAAFLLFTSMYESYEALKLAEMGVVVDSVKLKESDFKVNVQP